MIKIDLITGFLGAGKTTFIKKYAKYLTDQGQHIGIIENDFGAINIDMLLLQDIDSSLCEIEPIVGGNVVSDWKRRFKAKLILLSMQGVDRVIVEPSGIYDVDAFFEVLYEEPIIFKYEVGSIITLVDARLDERLSQQAKHLLASQLTNCGQVVLSKIEQASQQQLAATIQSLSDLLAQYKSKQRLTADKVLTKEWDDLSAADFEKLMNCGWSSGSCKAFDFDKNEVFTSLFMMHLKLPEEGIESCVKKLLADDTCGTVFRFKGFFNNEDGTWTEVNATRDHMEIKQVEKGQEVVIVIGEQLKEEVVRAYFS